MLEQILDFIHNYFIHDRVSGIFTISGGELTDVDMQTGQYFKIRGSVFNDGVHKDGDALTDETFRGEVWLMAVPKAVLTIADEVSDWMDKYGDANNSPYQSESFGGYSYSKSSDSTGGSATWQTVFGKRLNAYRNVN